MAGVYHGLQLVIAQPPSMKPTYFMIRTICLLCAFLCTIFMTVGRATAQTQSEQAGGSVPVLMALSANRNLDHPIIIRRADADPADVILFPKNMFNPRIVSVAVNQLLALRSALGDEPTQSNVFRVRLGEASGRGWKQDYFFAPQVVRAIHNAPVREIAGVGMAQAVEISAPRQQIRQ